MAIILERMTISFEILSSYTLFGNVHFHAEFDNDIFPYWVMNFHSQNTYRQIDLKQNVIGHMFHYIF